METTPHREEQRKITADVLAGIEKTHPIEAMIWHNWIESGEARVIEVSA